MKSGKKNANNRSGTVGGSNNKRRNNGSNTNDSSSSGRQWTNGEDSRHNKNFKRNADAKGRRGQMKREGDDDRPFNVNSVSSTNHSSYNNTSRPRRNEEDKERLKNRTNSHQKQNAGDDWAGGDQTTYWLKDEDDDEKYTLEGIRSPYYSLPFESKQVFQFGLDLSDNNR